MCICLIGQYIHSSWKEEKKWTKLSVSQSTTQQSTEASTDYSSIRIVCIVFTKIVNHNTRAKAIKETWGKRCKALIFISNSTVHLSDVSVFNINRTDDYNLIWGKTKAGFKHAFELFKDEADFFMKTDDDSFVVIENLQKMLVDKNVKPTDPIWFGNHFRLFTELGYMAGGGYVLSRESARRFVKLGLEIKDQNQCRTASDNGFEDLEMGRCLGSLGVVPGDSRDEYGRARMFCFNAETVLNTWLPEKSFWYWKYIKHPQYFGHPGCCSDRTVSYHYVTTKNIYLYDYLMYSAFVRGENNQKRTPPLPETLIQNINVDWKAIRG
ncbi:glycoprotein-N-acetylgalactosamine 3-beta-galactosyltransferase 1 isoform X2 [Lepeophtheirus salmonis]|nr:glycoprotein-N-acetylgalactosamine 3-beta-galactosyltransferase 1-like isoform X2 [Lepeophtheirus salmonis]XP_040571526.1 glycoprotein-N-acetylgalactosamine 3-beta-galactosyltransferase 1-like isoform X2 [Lepeophtheirus salmonis]XP_040571531.1 glycoprotein-N-acetylgalactosamine 3-beta-galactosyltransferase 1-like isoform X2 [Lepeophtheirus salmonis]XP_040571536.1 glycoprotein-N-acetylgalactosamine 3-beta-galactosyltransferase 1-like isoform X2 [Lepeophtheirus salmonis]